MKVIDEIEKSKKMMKETFHVCIVCATSNVVGENILGPN